jgi:ABC-type antimicrobial peptide transport system permease subunit
VDTNYVHLYDLPLLAGRNLQPSDTVREYVLNQTAVIKLGFNRPQDAIGQFLYNGSKALPIVGVVSDFQVTSVRESIRPVALVAYKQYANNISIKLNSFRPTDWQKTLAAIGSLWKRFYPDEPFNYAFYDQTLAAFYEQERTTGRIVNLATFVAILISCLGLFGLSIHMVFQRTKEIGVRKVLGSSVPSIVSLLAIDFLKPVFIALLLASPIAWYLMQWWLEDFAYRVDIKWWVFLVTSALTLSIALLTVIFQSVKAALSNPVVSLKSD